MEKDLDDIGKIAQGLKGKLEALDKAVYEFLFLNNFNQFKHQQLLLLLNSHIIC